MDAFLHRHYMPVAVSDLDELTNFGAELIDEIVTEFYENEILIKTENGYELNGNDECVCQLREHQKELQGRLD